MSTSNTSAPPSAPPSTTPVSLSNDVIIQKILDLVTFGEYVRISLNDGYDLEINTANLLYRFVERSSEQTEQQTDPPTPLSVNRPVSEDKLKAFGDLLKRRYSDLNYLEQTLRSGVTSPPPITRAALFKPENPCPDVNTHPNTFADIDTFIAYVKQCAENRWYEAEFHIFAPPSLFGAPNVYYLLINQSSPNVFSTYSASTVDTSIALYNQSFDLLVSAGKWSDPWFKRPPENIDAELAAVKTTIGTKKDVHFFRKVLYTRSSPQYGKVLADNPTAVLPKDEKLKRIASIMGMIIDAEGRNAAKPSVTLLLPGNRSLHINQHSTNRYVLNNAPDSGLASAPFAAPLSNTHLDFLKFLLRTSDLSELPPSLPLEPLDQVFDLRNSPPLLSASPNAETFKPPNPLPDIVEDTVYDTRLLRRTGSMAVVMHFARLHAHNRWMEYDLLLRDPLSRAGYRLLVNPSEETLERFKSGGMTCADCKNPSFVLFKDDGQEAGDKVVGCGMWTDPWFPETADSAKSVDDGWDMLVSTMTDVGMLIGAKFYTIDCIRARIRNSPNYTSTFVEQLRKVMKEGGGDHKWKIDDYDDAVLGVDQGKFVFERTLEGVDDVTGDAATDTDFEVLYKALRKYDLAKVTLAQTTPDALPDASSPSSSSPSSPPQKTAEAVVVRPGEMTPVRNPTKPPKKEVDGDEEGALDGDDADEEGEEAAQHEYDNKAREWWDVDAKKSNVLLAVIDRVHSIAGEIMEVKVAYADVAYKSIPAMIINLGQTVSNETHTRWMEVFKKPTTDNFPLRERLFAIWLGILTRISSMLMTHSVANNKAQGAMVNNLISEMLDYASKFARASEAPKGDGGHDEMLARGDHDKLIKMYKVCRQQVQKTMETVESVDPKIVGKLYFAERVWNSMEDVPSETIAHCRGNIESMGMCRTAELARLRLFRQRMEDALGYSIHRNGVDIDSHFLLHDVREHLFNMGTYKSLREEITDFIKSSDLKKKARAPLLKKYFEREALEEIRVRLNDEMRKDIETIITIIGRNGDYAKVTTTVSHCVGNMEWACSRTWQDNFDERAKTSFVQSVVSPNMQGATPPAVPSASDAGAGAGAGEASSMAGGGAGGFTMSGGAPTVPQYLNNRDGTNVYVVAGDEVNPRLGVAQVEREIINKRQEVHAALQVVRSGILEILTSGAPHLGKLGVFMHDVVIPRLQNVMVSLDTNVKRYMKTDYSAGMELSREERSHKMELMQNTRITPSRIVQYKFAETSVSLMYVLKLVRVISQVAALFAAKNFFSEIYMAAVYADGTPTAEGAGGPAPPDMTRLLYMFLAIDATVQLFILMVLVMLSFANKSQDNTYVIDDDFLMTFLAEYFITTVAIATLGVLFAKLMRNKKYFHYPTQGVTVVRAYRDIMVGVCGVVGVIPAFLLF